MLFYAAFAHAADYDVTRFGAIADGVTDSKPGIQAAIVAAGKAGGGKVVLPAADAPYLVRGTIIVKHSAVELSGRGARILLADGAINGQTAPVLLFTGTEQTPLRGVSLRGLTVDANYFNQTGAKNSKGAVFRFVVDSVVEDVVITRPYVGLSIRRSDRVMARRVTVTDYQEDGFDAGGDADEVPGGKATSISFVDVVARDAPRCAPDGNAFEIEDGAQGVLIQNALVENVAGNGAGLRNHNSQGNHSGNVEMRNVTFRKTGGSFAVFGRAAPRDSSAGNSYGEIRLLNVTADAPVAFWGPIRKLEITGGRFVSVLLGLDSKDGAASTTNALSDTAMKDLQIESLRINGASDRITMSGVSAKSIEVVRAR